MPFARNDDYELFYETAGEPTDRPLLLVSGFGAQAISWQDGFIDGWVERGWCVITMDNRDVGLSTKTQTAGDATDGAPYSLSDMAADCVAVLDALGFERAHVLGASMGGMIVQTLSIEHPNRVATMTSVMSSTGDPHVGRPAKAALDALLRPPAEGRDAFIDDYVDGGRVFAGPRFDEAWTRVRAGREYDRCFHPAGQVHQMHAITAGGDRTEQLRGVTAPTLVVHGRYDTLIPLDGGEATAAAVPGARLLVLDEMGHNIPISYWPEIYDAVADLARS
jgi:pimeloyl-ACP methyl ester carboxylesterase